VPHNRARLAPRFRQGPRRARSIGESRFPREAPNLIPAEGFSP
jgi:hypothetical protein